MPSHLRSNIKQKLQGVQNQLVKAGSGLQDVSAIYTVDHPDYEATFLYLRDAIAAINNTIEKITSEI